MSVEQRTSGGRRGAHDTTQEPRILLRLPDVAPPSKAAPARPNEPRKRAVPKTEDLADARTKLSERRFREGHQQVTEMIEKLRDRRRRLFKRLWAASVGLTALSVVALAVELVHQMEYPNSMDETVPTSEQPVARRKVPPDITASKSSRPKSAAPREWPNSLPVQSPVQSAIYETAGQAKGAGARLGGSILDDESDRSQSGELHDDPQSRAQ